MTLTPEARRASDLHTLRMLAWLVKQDRYRAERPRLERGHRGKADLVTIVMYAEAADWREADEAVRALEARQLASTPRPRPG